MDPKTAQSQFAGCILYKNSNPVEVLLVQPITRGKQRWAIPEIEVDAPEDMAEAVHKHVLEETGIAAKSVDYLGFVDYPRGRLHCFFGRVSATANPKLGHLHIRAVNLFPLEEAVKLVDKRQRRLLEAFSTSLAFLSDSA